MISATRSSPSTLKVCEKQVRGRVAAGIVVRLDGAHGIRVGSLGRFCSTHVLTECG